MGFSVLMAVDEFYPLGGGSGTVVYELSRQLVSKGHQVYVLTGRHQENLPKRDVINGINVVRYKVNKKFGLSYYYTSVKSSQKEFEIISREVKLDLLHLHTTAPSYGVLLSPESKKYPCLTAFYGPWCEEFEVESKERSRRFGILGRGLYRIYAGLLFSFMKNLQGKVLENGQKIVVLSDYSTESIKDLWGGKLLNKITLIPGGVDTERFTLPKDKQQTRKSLGIADDKFMFLTVRRLVPRMGLENLVKAVKIITQTRQDFVLHIGGRGILKPVLEELVAKLELEDFVKLIGFIPSEQLPIYYQSADAFILPTLALEGFGLISLEAMACGTPVLATPIGANPEVAGKFNSNFLTKGTSEQDLADKMLEFMSYKEENLAKKCRQFALAYSWDALSDKYIQLYEEISTR